MPLISLHDIRKRYGGQVDGVDGVGPPAVEVLRGVSLNIHAGEFVAIVGASGSGKSTLMNILGCLDQPSSGEYRFAGLAVEAMDADELAWLRREAFGFVFQSYNLIPTESALENVEVPAIYAGLSEDERRQRATALLQRLGLGDRLDNRPSQLSGGQQQRVSIARALVNGGRIILADEPTGALDSNSGKEVMALFDELAAAGHTVILITHDRDVAARAQRVIEIRDGEIVSDSQSEPKGAVGDAAEIARQMQADRGRVASLGSDLQEAARAAWRVMWVNRFRTALTLLGIIIGVASVIVMLGIGAGAQYRIMEQMSLFGANTMYVAAIPDSARERGGRMTLADVDAMRKIPNVQYAVPYLEGTVVARRGNVDHRSEGGGTMPDFLPALSWKMASGVMFNQDDALSLSKVAVIGDKVKQVLFEDGSDPVGQTILVDSVPFQVIGVLQAKGARAGQVEEDNRILFPFATASARIYGNVHPTWTAVAVHDMARSKETEEMINKVLFERRQTNDFRVYNSVAMIQAQTATAKTMALMLAFIGAISLLVGGIGVMNIMLMTVRERTREIGIRMATGARQRDIMRQFLTEAVLVSVVGGIAGVLLGILIGIVIRVAGVPLIFSLTAIAGSFACALSTGLIFGFMPARRAAQLNPVQALATE